MIQPRNSILHRIVSLANSHVNLEIKSGRFSQSSRLGSRRDVPKQTDGVGELLQTGSSTNTILSSSHVSLLLKFITSSSRQCIDSRCGRKSQRPFVWLGMCIFSIGRDCILCACQASQTHALFSTSNAWNSFVGSQIFESMCGALECLRLLPLLLVSSRTGQCICFFFKKI